MSSILLLDVLLALGIYNKRINGKLLALSLALSNEELVADRGAFFGSIWNQWNHLMFGDLMLLRRIRDSTPQDDAILGDLSMFPVPRGPRDVYFDDMSAFATCRHRLDDLLLRWSSGIRDITLKRKLRYRSTEGDFICVGYGALALHLFMHQLHHRGQLTTLFSQLGIEYGCMDMPVIVPEGLGGDIGSVVNAIP